VPWFRSQREVRRCALLAVLLVPAFPVRGAERVWIDTDVSIGSPVREVDDAYALVLAFHSRKLAIAGISTSFGNASLPQTDRIAREMTARFGAPAGLTINNVHAGAASRGDLGKETPATIALASALRPGPLTYVALAPLTNLATTLALHPELARSIKRVIFVGGISPGERLYAGNNHFLQIHDANVTKDSAAVARVLNARVPLTLIPPSSAGRLEITPTDAKILGGSEAGGRYLVERSGTWLWFWRTIAGTDGGPIFDAFALQAVANPESIVTERRFARVDGESRLVATRVRQDKARPVLFCVGTRKDIKPEVIRLLLSYSRDR
jgi:inosine-uridine nucleoside N-ribohydrolase